MNKIPKKTSKTEINVMKFNLSPRIKTAKSTCQKIPVDLNKVVISTPETKIPKFPAAIIVPYDREENAVPKRASLGGKSHRAEKRNFKEAHAINKANGIKRIICINVINKGNGAILNISLLYIGIIVKAKKFSILTMMILKAYIAFTEFIKNKYSSNDSKNESNDHF